MENVNENLFIIIDMPKSRNKRKNKARNVAIKEQAMNIANKKIRESRDNHPANIFDLTDNLIKKYI